MPVIIQVVHAFPALQRISQAAHELLCYVVDHGVELAVNVKIVYIVSWCQLLSDGTDSVGQ